MCVYMCESLEIEEEKLLGFGKINFYFMLCVYNSCFIWFVFLWLNIDECFLVRN